MSLTLSFKIFTYGDLLSRSICSKNGRSLVTPSWTRFFDDEGGVAHCFPRYVHAALPARVAFVVANVWGQDCTARRVFVRCTVVRHYTGSRYIIFLLLIVAQASRNLTHCIKQWNGSFFARTSLCEAGLTVHLGHEGLRCLDTESDPTMMTVIDTTGIHIVRVQFCGCGAGASTLHYIQILRADWWPATIQRPRTAFTVRCLDAYHKLTLQSKINAFDYYHGLVRITDASGLLNHMVRLIHISNWIFT